jgi:geranylgeranyl diphosphate synthase, type II
VAVLGTTLRWEAGHCIGLAEAIRYAVLAPGKRLRPSLAIWGGQAVEGSFEECLPPAIAIELIHCYSLIHDDLPAMDDDDLRRGRPTCHIQFDEATAILAGDALQPMAFEVLATQITESERARQHRIHARKTGAAIECSVVMGGIVCGADTDALDKLSEYGQAIGQAFQIIDDLLDVTGTAEQLGKRTGKDFQRGKLTYPGFYGVEASQKAASEYTNRAMAIAASFGPSGGSLVHLARHLLERTH